MPDACIQYKTALFTVQNCTFYNTKLHLSQYKTVPFTIQNCTFHNTQLYKTTLFTRPHFFTKQDCTCHNTKLHLSQYKTTLVTIQNRTCHNTKLHLSQNKAALVTIQDRTFSQYKTAPVTIQNRSCHNTKLHISQDPNTKRFKRMLIYFNTDTQYANFRSNPPLSIHKTTLKQQINRCDVTQYSLHHTNYRSLSCQQSCKHQTSCKNSTARRCLFLSLFLTVYQLFKCHFVA